MVEPYGPYRCTPARGRKARRPPITAINYNSCDTPPTCCCAHAVRSRASGQRVRPAKPSPCKQIGAASCTKMTGVVPNTHIPVQHTFVAPTCHGQHTSFRPCSSPFSTKAQPLMHRILTQPQTVAAVQAPFSTQPVQTETSYHCHTRFHTDRGLLLFGKAQLEKHADCSRP